MTKPWIPGNPSLPGGSGGSVGPGGPGPRGSLKIRLTVPLKDLYCVILSKRVFRFTIVPFSSLSEQL